MSDSQTFSRVEMISLIVRLSLFTAVTFLSVRWMINQLDPTSKHKKKAKKKAEEQLKRLGITQSKHAGISQLTEYEMVIAGHLVDPSEIPVSWSDIAGLEDVIQELRETVILPIKRKELFADSQLTQPPKGVLLHGPPGCGKTLIAKATAKEAGTHFINLDVSILTDKWYGESQKLAAAVFTLAVKLQPCTIFIDEIDSFLRNRNSQDHEATAMMKAQFMSLWDGLITDPNCTVIVMGATNRPQDLDRAILRRMPATFHIGMPNVHQRRQILRLILEHEPTSDEVDLNRLARLTENFSGSDLREMCRNASVYRVRDYVRETGQKEPEIASSSNGIDGEEVFHDALRPITMDDLLMSLNKMKESKLHCGVLPIPTLEIKSKLSNIKSENFSASATPLHVCVEEQRGPELGSSSKDACQYSRMANTISNMKMTNPIKNLVSKRRKRYTQDGFNLDLTSMGFPAEKLEGVYRNHIDDVFKFLESKHKDHYKIYNLCSERSYDSSKFHQRVAIYAFDDHNPPKMELIKPFCADVHEWLSKDQRNGRTGVMVCCYLLHSRQYTGANDALNYYAKQRTHDRKGVTIPSQKRYVGYYATLVQEQLSYHPVSLFIREIRLEPLPTVNGTQGLQLVISECSNKVYSSPVYMPEKGANSLCIRLDQYLTLQGDVKVEFFSKPKMKRKEKLFHFWFNTFFVRDEVTVPDSASAVNGNEDGELVPPPDRSSRAMSYDEQARMPQVVSRHPRTGSLASLNSDSKMLLLRLDKWGLDDAHKDKQNKLYSEDFKVSLFMLRVPVGLDEGPPTEPSWLATGPRPSAPPPGFRETPSESSEADSTDSDTTAEDEEDEEDGWESENVHVPCVDEIGSIFEEAIFLLFPIYQNLSFTFNFIKMHIMRIELNDVSGKCLEACVVSRNSTYNVVDSDF
ncbi:Spastin [Gryllus bimaculatus]|nr:Spastin [Gryllus bimaculatus]